MSGEWERICLNAVIHVLTAELQTFEAAFMWSLSSAAVLDPDISYCVPPQPKRPSIGRYWAGLCRADWFSAPWSGPTVKSHDEDSKIIKSFSDESLEASICCRTDSPGHSNRWGLAAVAAMTGNNDYINIEGRLISFLSCPQMMLETHNGGDAAVRCALP